VRAGGSSGRLAHVHADRNGAEHAAKQILAGRQRTAGEKIRTPPRHVVDDDAPGAPPEPEQLPLDGA